MSLELTSLELTSLELTSLEVPALVAPAAARKPRAHPTPVGAGRLDTVAGWLGTVGPHADRMGQADTPAGNS